MSKRGDRELLSDIQEAALRIEQYSKKLSYGQFVKDTKTQDAVVRNLEIIGEASKNISKEVKQKYREIAWSDLAKVRDKLIHHYFGVNLDIVWEIIHHGLPETLTGVSRILKKKSI